MNIDFNTKIVMRILMLKCNDSSLMNLWESIIEIIKNPKHNVFAGKENLWISSALKACWFLKSSPFDKSGFDNSDNDLSDGVFHILLSDEPELSLNDKRYLSKYNIESLLFSFDKNCWLPSSRKILFSRWITTYLNFSEKFKAYNSINFPCQTIKNNKKPLFSGDIFTVVLGFFNLEESFTKY